MTWEVNSTSILQWYSNASDLILDRVCCCSYADDQVTREAEAHSYYQQRSTVVPSYSLVEEGDDTRDGEEVPQRSHIAPVVIERRDAVIVGHPCVTRESPRDVQSSTRPSPLHLSPCENVLMSIGPATKPRQKVPLKDFGFGKENRSEAEVHVGIGHHSCKRPTKTLTQIDKNLLGKKCSNASKVATKVPLSNYSRSVLRQVQNEGRTNLQHLHFTRGQQC